MEATSLETILGRAVAQSTLALLFKEGLWQLSDTPVEVDAEASPLLPSPDWIAPPGAMELHAQNAGDVGGVSLTDGSETISWRSSDRIALRAKGEWIVGGVATVGTFLESRRFPPVSRLEIAFDARWLSIPVGARLALEGIDKPAPATRQGELAELHYENGVCRGVISPASETSFHSDAAFSVVQRSARHHAVRFFIQGRVVAVLHDDGNLRIRGGIIEHGMPGTPTSLLFVYVTGEQTLQVNFHNGALSSCIGFTAAGDLRTSVEIIENAQVTEPGTPGVGGMRAECSVLGGTATTAAALKLDSTAVRIRGVILTNQKL